MIKMYLAGVRNMHIAWDSQTCATVPPSHYCNEYRWESGKYMPLSNIPSTQVRLPINPTILDSLYTHWEGTKHPNRLVLWAASTLCFTALFCLGKLLTLEGQPATPTCVQWDDIIVDDAQCLTMLEIHLEISNCDQFGKGIDIYVGNLEYFGMQMIIKLLLEYPEMHCVNRT